MEVAGHVVVEVGVVTPSTAPPTTPTTNATSNTTKGSSTDSFGDVSLPSSRQVRGQGRPPRRSLALAPLTNTTTSTSTHHHHLILVRFESLVDEDGRKVLLPHLLLPHFPGASRTFDVSSAAAAASGRGPERRSARARRGRLGARSAVSGTPRPRSGPNHFFRRGASGGRLVVDVGHLVRGQVGDDRHPVVEVGRHDLRGPQSAVRVGVGVCACAVRHVTSAGGFRSCRSVAQWTVSDRNRVSVGLKKRRKKKKRGKKVGEHCGGIKTTTTIRFACELEHVSHAT